MTGVSNNQQQRTSVSTITTTVADCKTGVVQHTNALLGRKTADACEKRDTPPDHPSRQQDASGWWSLMMVDGWWLVVVEARRPPDHSPTDHHDETTTTTTTRPPNHHHNTRPPPPDGGPRSLKSKTVGGVALALSVPLLLPRRSTVDGAAHQVIQLLLLLAHHFLVCAAESGGRRCGLLYHLLSSASFPLVCALKHSS